MPLADAPTMLAPRGAAPRFWLPRHCAARRWRRAPAGGGAGGAARARLRPGRRGAGAHLRRGRRLRVEALLPRAPRTSELDRQPDALRAGGAPILRARPVARDRQRRRRRLRDGGRRAAVRAWARGDRCLRAAPRVDLRPFSLRLAFVAGAQRDAALPARRRHRFCHRTDLRARRRRVRGRRGGRGRIAAAGHAARRVTPGRGARAARRAPRELRPRQRWNTSLPQGVAALPRGGGRRSLPAPRWPCASASSAAPPAGATRPRRGARPAPLRPTTRRVCSSGSGGRWHPESCAAPRSAVFD